MSDHVYSNPLYQNLQQTKFNSQKYAIIQSKYEFLKKQHLEIFNELKLLKSNNIELTQKMIDRDILIKNLKKLIENIEFKQKYLKQNHETQIKHLNQLIKQQQKQFSFIKQKSELKEGVSKACMQNSEIYKLKTEIQQLKNNSKKLQQEIETYKSDINAKQIYIQEIRNSKIALFQQNCKKSKQYVDATEKIHILQKQINEKNKMIQELKIRADQYNQKWFDSCNKSVCESNQIKDLKNKINCLQIKNEQYKKINIDQMNLLYVFQEDIQLFYHKKIQQMKSQIEQIQSQITNLTNIIELKQQELLSYRNKEVQLQSKIQQLNTVISKMKAKDLNHKLSQKQNFIIQQEPSQIQSIYLSSRNLIKQLQITSEQNQNDSELKSTNEKSIVQENDKVKQMYQEIINLNEKLYKKARNVQQLEQQNERLKQRLSQIEIIIKINQQNFEKIQNNSRKTIRQYLHKNQQNQILINNLEMQIQILQRKNVRLQERVKKQNTFTQNSFVLRQSQISCIKQRQLCRDESYHNLYITQGICQNLKNMINMLNQNNQQVKKMNINNNIKCNQSSNMNIAYKNMKKLTIEKLKRIKLQSNLIKLSQLSVLKDAQQVKVLIQIFRPIETEIESLFQNFIKF